MYILNTDGPLNRQAQRAVVTSDVSVELSRTCWQISNQSADKRAQGWMPYARFALSWLLLLAAV